MQRILQAGPDERRADFTGAAPQRDLSRVRLHTPAAEAIQTKLTVNAPGDIHEQEADRTADQVMRMPEPAHQRARAYGNERGQPNPPASTEPLQSLPQPDTAVQRAPAGPAIQPAPVPLEVVARDVANVIAQHYRLNPGPVLSAVRDTYTGAVYFALNSGVPPLIANVVAQAISAQQQRLAAKEVKLVRTDPDARKGGHSEAIAVNHAVRAREALLNRAVTEAELHTFELHNVWLKGAKARDAAAPRCEHCSRIVRSVSVTSSVFFAEGGVSGEIKGPPAGGRRNPVVGPGGPTGSIAGTITVPDKPPATPAPAPPTTAVPTKTTTKTGGQNLTLQPEIPSSTGVRKGSTPRQPASPGAAAAATLAAADLLSIVFSPYIFPDAEEEYEQRLQTLRNKLQPTIEARIDELLRIETPRIAELGSSGTPLFITAEIVVWEQASDVTGAPVHPVNLILEDLNIDTENINKKEPTHSLAEVARCGEIGHCKSYQFYSIPVPSAIQQEALRRLHGVGAFDLKQFNYHADTLKSSSDRERLTAVLNMYKLVKDGGLLQGPAIRQLIPVLRDEKENVRAVAAMALRSLGATEAIPFLRQAVAETNSPDKRDVIQKQLDLLQKSSK